MLVRTSSVGVAAGSAFPRLTPYEFAWKGLTVRYGCTRATVYGALLVAALSIVSACATVVAGTPVNVRGQIVDPAVLDVGNYPTTPRPPLGTAGTASAGAIIEAQRLANYVVGPWEIDPALKNRAAMGAVVIDRPDALKLVAPAELAAISAANRFINGFASPRQADVGKSLLNAVLRFADAASAAAVVSELGRRTPPEPRGDEVQRISIPGHPDALATSYTFVDAQTNRRWFGVRAFTSRGPYLLTQLAQSVDGLQAAATLVANTLMLQGLVIDQFPATEPIDFADIAVDPTGLLARTLPMPARDATLAQNARFGKRGALHFQNDPIRSGALFDQAVVDLAARAKTNVYRTSDYDAAVQIVEEFRSQAQSAGGDPVDGVEFMPDSRCVQAADGIYCVAPAGRFAIEAESRSLDDAHQQVAAQYRLLIAQ